MALVVGGGEGVGRALALSLSARGVRVVVAGGSERRLGEVVGEIANAAGKARHAVVDPSDPSSVALAVERARTAFGPVDIFASCTGHVETALDAATRAIEGAGRIVVFSEEIAENARHTIATVAASVRARGLTVNAACASFVQDGPALEPEEVAELLVFLCTAASDRISGQTIALTGVRPDGGLM